VYTTLRSAHLERAHQLPPAAIVYVNRRYDFEESLTTGLELVRTSPARAALLLARSPVEVLEVNEPLMRSGLPLTSLAILAVRLRGAVTRERTEVVCYAIGNDDPWKAPPPDGARPALRRWIDRRLARWVWRRLDRICFGTPAARDVYREAFPPNRACEALIAALPSPLPPPSRPADPAAVVFVGALSRRKGLDLLLEAWPLVRQALPEARLRILGKGDLEADARTAADADQTITVAIDPPRDAIQSVLLGSAVLVLPSQPVREWREQVGLPIVEGLAAGCSIVTTSETGLAPWLEEHGHTVVPPGRDVGALAGAIVSQIAARRTSADVTASLPSTDGRLAADAWLFGDRGLDA
jgi:glycosyltransferase involved in cell wall biosynthesis